MTKWRTWKIYDGHSVFIAEGPHPGHETEVIEIGAVRELEAECDAIRKGFSDYRIEMARYTSDKHKENERLQFNRAAFNKLEDEHAELLAENERLKAESQDRRNALLLACEDVKRLRAALEDASHHLSDIEHSCRRYQEVEKENIAIVKILPALERVCAALTKESGDTDER